MGLRRLEGVGGLFWKFYIYFICFSFLGLLRTEMTENDHFNSLYTTNQWLIIISYQNNGCWTYIEQMRGCATQFNCGYLLPLSCCTTFKPNLASLYSSGGLFCVFNWTILVNVLFKCFRASTVRKLQGSSEHIGEGLGQMKLELNQKYYLSNQYPTWKKINNLFSAIPD